MKSRIRTTIFAAVGMLILILDSKTALGGASEGLKLCLQAVIPSLFPFFIFSTMLTSSLNGVFLPFLRPLGKLCGIPEGAESLLIVGLLGGYPVGAQNVAAAYQDGLLSKETARRMLGFCSNAGPAFLFGIVAGKFQSWWICWVLWGIHVLSAIFVGAVLPNKNSESIRMVATKPVSIQTALQKSISVMTGVCGWIILFRILISFLNKRLLWLLPESGQSVLIGILELTNGCCELERIENTGLRFIFASGILAFGGLCIVMQTASVTGELGLGSYLNGKILQTIISVILAFGVQLLFPADERINIPAAAVGLAPVLLALFAIVIRESEKTVAFRKGFVYNKVK